MLRNNHLIHRLHLNRCSIENGHLQVLPPESELNLSELVIINNYDSLVTLTGVKKLISLHPNLLSLTLSRHSQLRDESVKLVCSNVRHL